MEAGFLNMDLGELFVGDLDPQRISMVVNVGLDSKPAGRADVADQIDDDGPADQRPAMPIFRDMAEHAVFNLVPLARSGWKMADRDLQAQSIRQLLEAPFPETVAGAIASASVRRDQQPRRAVVNPAAHFSPPAFN